jgi:cytochrome d ubiquinol oxidase subunit II
MASAWFAIVVVMLAAYVALDGFDFGAGAVHLFVARTDEERRRVLAAIGPFWDGNEVWLLAAGGALFVAFPKVLAAGLSGFYLAIFLVIWSLILRGAAIEFRSHAQSPVWRAAWDFVFAAASALLAVVLGAALGNVLRGVPLGEDGLFELAFFTDFSPRGAVGILDWYTVSSGVFALAALAAHGALFLAWKTDGALRERSRRAAARAGIAALALFPGLTWATARVSPALFVALPARPLAWAGAAAAAAGVAAALVGFRRGRDLAAFLGSSAFIVGILGASAACLYPVVLPAIGGARLSLTAEGASAAPESLAIALRWWALGFPLAVAYFVLVFRLHRGKAPAAGGPEGY